MSSDSAQPDHPCPAVIRSQQRANKRDRRQALRLSSSAVPAVLLVFAMLVAGGTAFEAQGAIASRTDARLLRDHTIRDHRLTQQVLSKLTDAARQLRDLHGKAGSLAALYQPQNTDLAELSTRSLARVPDQRDAGVQPLIESLIDLPPPMC